MPHYLKMVVGDIGHHFDPWRQSIGGILASTDADLDHRIVHLRGPTREERGRG